MAVIEDCTSALDNDPKYIKAIWRRAIAYEKQEKYIDAQEDYKKILEIEPNHDLAQRQITRLEPLVKTQFEEQKEEVMGKLKDFANWGLGKVGLSLNNFETKQDPNTGGYSIQFKQNANATS